LFFEQAVSVYYRHFRRRNRGKSKSPHRRQRLRHAVSRRVSCSIPEMAINEKTRFHVEGDKTAIVSSIVFQPDSLGFHRAAIRKMSTLQGKPR
jgi:hypothetical protein